MALDHALMGRARHTRETVLRVYSWAAPVLSLGRNQRAAGVYDDLELAHRGIGVVRRPTGGRALLHHREITYSVTAPASDDDGLRATYGRVNELLLRALEQLGVPASLAQPTSRSALPSALPCFAEPAAGEIVAAGGKLVGSAQWREHGALLQHGSIVVDDDQSLIPELMVVPAPASPAPATLRALLSRAPDSAEVADTLFTVVRATVDPFATPLLPAELDALDVRALVDHYGDPSWTWRR
jgi:lipoate-protein ligase A